jgi:hypothetical protein
MSDNPFKISFKLKQHTPLIHFQHNQKGATLRATELKPKLDKFLIERVFKKDRKKYEKYLIDKDKDALNYKVKIVYKDVEFFDIEQSIPKPNGKFKTVQFPLFFANMGLKNKDEKRRFSFTEKPIEVEFFSLYPEILELIEKNFAAFLILNNFGTRQSKGFGSFYIHPDDPHYKKLRLNYHFTIELNKKRALKDNLRLIFEKIELFYKSLRAGINDFNFHEQKTSFYFKSMMFAYAKSKNIQWDKKSIKEKFFNSYLKNQAKEHNNDELLTFKSNQKYLIKELLGLSTEESWKSYDASIKRESEGIERFPSPLFFKPLIEDNVAEIYFEPLPIKSKMYNAEFNITSSTSRDILSLSTPPKDVFTVKDFLDFAINVDLTKHVQNEYQKNQKFNDLKEIYSKIKSYREKITNKAGGKNG